MSDGYAGFVEAQVPRLLGYARALAGNEHDAWDMVQETLVRMGLRWSKVDRQGNPGAYARTTLARLNVDRLRHRGRQRPVAAVPEIGWTPAESVVEPWLVEALGDLPVKQRTALVLRYVDDLDHAGIARGHGVRGRDRSVPRVTGIGRTAGSSAGGVVDGLGREGIDDE